MAKTSRPTKERADVLLVQRGLAETRAKAAAIILGGRVFCGERRIEKAGDRLSIDADIELRGEKMPFVSRGGLKLEGALRAFDFAVEGLVAADFGASTGGFTDCLLQRGAIKVFAIDVGYGQLHEKLRTDERVINMERVNARELQAEDLPEPVAVIVIDASFISLVKLLPAAHRLLTPDGHVVAMVKPQFEVGRELVGKGGVVRDAVTRQAAIDGVSAKAAELGFVERARADAVIRGPRGNHEAFLLLQKSVVARESAHLTG